MVDEFDDDDNLEEEEEEKDEMDSEDRWDGQGENLEAVTFACEDCDYRWEEQTEEDAEVMVCPMCGSTNVTEL